MSMYLLMQPRELERRDVNKKSAHSNPEYIDRSVQIRTENISTDSAVLYPLRRRVYTGHVYHIYDIQGYQHITFKVIL